MPFIACPSVAADTLKTFTFIKNCKGLKVKRMKLLFFIIIKFESVGGQWAGPCATVPGLIVILGLSGREPGYLEAV